MVDLAKLTYPEEDFEKFYRTVKKIFPEKDRKNELHNNLAEILFMHGEETAELEGGPTPSQIEKLLKKYDTSIRKLINETEKLYPPLIDEENDREWPSIPRWLSPSFESLNSIINNEGTGHLQTHLRDLIAYRNGGKPRFFARNYWLKKLKAIYEKHTGEIATADKNHDTKFAEFVLQFYKMHKNHMRTSEHMNRDVIYKFIKTMNNNV